jgi:hypothetical protein
MRAVISVRLPTTSSELRLATSGYADKSAAVLGILGPPTSIPIPKLASFRATQVYELWNRKNQQLIDLLRIWLATPHLGANRRNDVDLYTAPITP